MARLPADQRGADCKRGSSAAQPELRAAQQLGGRRAGTRGERGLLAASRRRVRPPGYPPGVRHDGCWSRIPARPARRRWRPRSAPHCPAIARGSERGRWAAGRGAICSAIRLPDYGRAWIYWTDASGQLSRRRQPRRPRQSGALPEWWAAFAGGISRDHRRHRAPAHLPHERRASHSSRPCSENRASSCRCRREERAGTVRGATSRCSRHAQGPSLKPRAHVVCRLLGGDGPDGIEAWLMPFIQRHPGT